MWRMLQQDEATDYVVATGTDFSVKDFVQFSFDHVGLDWEKYVRTDGNYLRPTEVDSLVGDASKAEAALGWRATVHPQQLAQIMVDHDLSQIDGHVVDVPDLAAWKA